MLLRPYMMSFHPSKRPVHLAERPNCVGDEIGTAIAFMSRDKLMLTLDPETLLENLLFSNLDSLFRCDSSIGHAIGTLAPAKGSRPRHNWGALASSE